MAMQISQEGSDDDEVMSAINTTPLVDVMLVLLIIFLITIPVATHTVPVKLPEEVIQPTQTKPETVVLAVNSDGDIFWNEKKLSDAEALSARLIQAVQRNSATEVQVRADQDARYEFVGRVVLACNKAGITKVSFITEPSGSR